MGFHLFFQIGNLKKKTREIKVLGKNREVKSPAACLAAILMNVLNDFQYPFQFSGCEASSIPFFYKKIQIKTIRS